MIIRHSPKVGKKVKDFSLIDCPRCGYHKFEVQARSSGFILTCTECGEDMELVINGFKRLR